VYLAARYFSWAAVSACCLILTGCGDSAGGVDVSGNITYRGKPLGEGDIAFFPASGHPIGALVDSSGNYTATLPPGEYRVIIGKSNPLPPGWKEGDPQPPPKDPLPAKFTEPTSTELKATVTGSQTEPINFALK
jgi:hypothetical protein